MNAFFNLFDVISDMFKVKIYLFSAIQKALAANAHLAIKYVAVVIISSNLSAQTHMLTLTYPGSHTVMRPGNAKPFANTLKFSGAASLALDFTVWLPIFLLSVL